MPPIRIVGMFKGAIKVVENLFGKDPHRCGYFVCDVERDVLEASPVPGRLLPMMNNQSKQMNYEQMSEMQ